MSRFLFVVFFVALVSTSQADEIINGNFDDGLSGWTPFTLNTGTEVAGFPQVLDFNTTGSGVSTAAAIATGGTVALPFQGAGIFQEFTATAGQYRFSVDAAVQNISNAETDGGFLFFSNVGPTQSSSTGIDTLNLAPGQIVRQTFVFIANLDAGINRLELETWRLSPPGPVIAYFDNVSVRAVPEPGSLVLLAFGGLGLTAYSLHRRKFVNGWPR